MAHTIFQTEGIVVGGFNVGEGHRILQILTKDLGMVKAHARSVREERSKMRYALQQFSHVHISLVRGKEQWRITGAEELRSFYRDTDNESRGLLSKIGFLLRRLVQGEEESAHLYELLVETLRTVSERNHSKESLEQIEYLFILRMLFELGYLSGEKYEHLLRTRTFLDDELAEVQERKNGIRLSINEALQETQL